MWLSGILFSEKSLLSPLLPLPPLTPGGGRKSIETGASGWSAEAVSEKSKVLFVASSLTVYMITPFPAALVSVVVNSSGIGRISPEEQSVSQPKQCKFSETPTRVYLIWKNIFPLYHLCRFIKTLLPNEWGGIDDRQIRRQ